MRYSDWIQEFLHAGRALRRTPGFVITTVAMLGLAIGVTSGIFSVVNTVLLDRLPYPEPQQLVHVAATAPGTELAPEFGVAAEFVVHYRERSRLLEDLSTYNSFTSTLRTADRVERIRMSMPTNSLYSTLGVAPALGRLPVEDDADRAVVLSDALWTSWFGRDPTVIGRSVAINSTDRTVIGIMGPEFRFPAADTQLWISSTIGASDITRSGNFGHSVVARMAAGTTPEAVADELSTLARELPERFGGTAAYARIIEQHRAVVRTLEEQLLGRFTRPLWVLLGAAAIVLLIACANVANLFLVRNEGRNRELATRRALGAPRGRLVRQQMAEAILIAAGASALAVLLAALVLPFFLKLAPSDIPRLDQVSIGPATLLFALVAAALSALICGIVPAWRAASPDLSRLRDGSRGNSRGSNWLRSGLVVGQTALALVLLIGSGLLLRSVHTLQQVHPGYDARDVFTFQIAPERPELSDAPSFARFNLDFLDRLKALPGVQSVGLVENVPIDEGTASMRIGTEGGDAEGTLLNFTYSAGDYYRTMGIALRAGRVFVDDDHGSARGNVIVSATAAERLWPQQDPIGKRLRRIGHENWETVVGVVDDVMQDGPLGKPQAVVYFPMVDTTPQGGRAISSPAFVLKSERADSIGGLAVNSEKVRQFRASQ